ncbi:MAG: hypothetical protein HYV07_34370, partial [Deltaproteobacteria bacterium]|nr:hypothetical protein [Deltaproteobacteria bacterium]
MIVGLTGAMAVGLVALSLGVPEDGCGGEAELDSAQSEARGGGSTGGGGTTTGGTTPLARAGYTTAVDPSVCEGNKSNTNNCNIYDKKTDVYMNGGPTAYALPANRLMYFTVLAPSAQNGGFIDAAAGNLSSNHDPYCNRLFKITDVGGVRDLVYPVPQSENPS